MCQKGFKGQKTPNIFPSSTWLRCKLEGKLPSAVKVLIGEGSVFSLIFICHVVEVGVKEILCSTLNKLLWAIDSSFRWSQAPTTTAAALFRACSYSYQAKKRNCFDNKDVVVKESYLASNYNANIIIKRVIQRIFWILQTQGVWAYESWFWGWDKQHISMLWFCTFLSTGYFGRAVPFYLKRTIDHFSPYDKCII